jgi:O-methyltransferase
MRRIIVGMFRRLACIFSIPVVLSMYFDPETGKEYGVGFVRKIGLAFKMRRNYRHIITASYVIEHLIMATQILRVPKAVPGSVVECGSFKGGSAANLSLVCDMCGRRLKIFDSFAGLPDPATEDSAHRLVGLRQVHTYAKGAWAGAIGEVKGNIAKYGKINVCDFHVGFFEKTLVTFDEPCILAFVDVDLRKSLETCLENIWPHLQNACYLFTHEAPHFEISSLFFSETWWNSRMHTAAPGLVGAGTGLGLLPDSGGFRSDLGYTVKNSEVSGFTLNPQTGSGRIRGAAPQAGDLDTVSSTVRN